MEKIAYICKSELRDLSKYPWIVDNLTAQTKRRIDNTNLYTWIYAQIFKDSFDADDFDKKVNSLLDDVNYITGKMAEYERRSK